MVKQPVVKQPVVKQPAGKPAAGKAPQNKAKNKASAAEAKQGGAQAKRARSSGAPSTSNKRRKADVASSEAAKGKPTGSASDNDEQESIDSELQRALELSKAEHGAPVNTRRCGSCERLVIDSAVQLCPDCKFPLPAVQ